MSWGDLTARSRMAALALAAAALLAHASIAASAAQADVTFYASPAGKGNCTSATAACSLAEAITRSENHDNHGSAVTVQLAPGTYPAASVSGGAETSLTLDGAGAASSAISGEGKERALTVAPGKKPARVTIENLTLEDGNAGERWGGDLYASSVGALELLDDTIVGGQAEGGGGIAIAGEDEVSIGQSTLSGDANGALLLQNGKATVKIGASTLTANPQGAIVVAAKAKGSSLTVENSTVSSNAGGAITWDAPGTGAVYGSTVADNTGGGALALQSTGGKTELRIGGDILAEDESSCSPTGEGEILDEGYNLATDESCPLTQPTSKGGQPPSELHLEALAANGGPTQTQRIASASLAHDYVPLGAQLGEGGPVLCTEADQRGVARTQPEASACDAGAYQIAPPSLTPPASALVEPGMTLTLAGANLAYVTSVTLGAGNPATIAAQSATSLSVVVPQLPPGAQTLTVTNPDGSAQLPLIVVASPTITTGSLPAGVRGVAYSAQVSALGGVIPYGWSATGLPPGLSIGPFTGTISGDPTGLGKYGATITVTDFLHVSASVHLALTITPGKSTSTCIPSPVIRGLCAALGIAVRPAIGSAAQSHRRWREGRRYAHVSSTHGPPIGTRFTFTLNEQASVTLVFARKVGGRRIGGRCVAVDRKNARRRKCTRSVHAGKLSFTGKAGANAVLFQGRLSRKHWLAHGSYTLTITASTHAGSASRSLSFTILR